MTPLEIFLLVAGIICVLLSFVVGIKDIDKDENSTSAQIEQRELTEQEKERIRRQIDGVIDEQIQDLAEKTEAQLDKISNTKILEMNDYAETVISEINRNHNETVFLYDMLNEKAKEVKTTVKDVNIAKKEVAKIQDNITYSQVLASDMMSVSDVAADLDNTEDDDILNPEEWARRVEDAEKAALAQILSDKNKSSKKNNSQADSYEADNIQLNEANKTEIILSMYNGGMTVKNIAKKLNLGIGEVKLIVDLHNNK